MQIVSISITNHITLIMPSNNTQLNVSERDYESYYTYHINKSKFHLLYKKKDYRLNHTTYEISL